MVRAAFILALIATPVLADEPLAPPVDFSNLHGDVAVFGDAAAGTTTMSPIGQLDAVEWTIPVWARWYQLSPDGFSILVLNPNGNLLPSQDPDQIVATVYYTSEMDVLSRDVTLAQTMAPNDMPRTTSHFLWLRTYRTTQTGWELDLSNGKSVIIAYR